LGGGGLLALLLLALLVSGCKEADRLAGVAPRLLSTGGGTELRPELAPESARPPGAMPPELPADGFEFEPIGTDQDGRRQFHVHILEGGSPYLVATQKLTPLFQVDGKGPVEYVTDAYFASNPGRTPRSIQPDDEFVLTLPPDAFVVRWQEERTGDLGRPTRLHEYVSDRGDRLRFYLSDRYPILYEVEPAASPGVVTVQFHPDLAYLLGAGRLDPIELARLAYRVDNPDMRQVANIRQLAAAVKPGQSISTVVDRTRTYLDPIREAMSHASTIERVPYPGRSQLTRGIFTLDQGKPFVAIEDALGTRTEISDLPPGQVFRIEYGWDGIVRVAYITGDDDGRGRRDPYGLRENERWAALYAQYVGSDRAPVAWGPGEPSDLESFPTARDPNRRVQDGERSFDYLLPGRAMLLTFRPIRLRADTRAEAELRDILRDLRDRYRDDISDGLTLLGSFLH